MWAKRRDWTPKKRRARKVKLSERGIYEPVELEEDVVQKIIALLWYSGIPVFRERERVPNCPSCGKFVSKPSEAGHPDLHGWLPSRKNSSRTATPFYIECKRPDGGVETEVQKEFIRRARRDGVLAFFAHEWSDVWWNFWGIGVRLPEG